MWYHNQQALRPAPIKRIVEENLSRDVQETSVRRAHQDPELLQLGSTLLIQFSQTSTHC